MTDRIVRKIQMNHEDIVATKNVFLDDAEVVVVAYGIRRPCRPTRRAGGQDSGLKAGLVKLDTVWPFPEELIRSLAPT
jgi:2-oxoglutarate ferredoxin oxidoreductase subunit alpha